MPCDTVLTPESILKDSNRMTGDDCFTFRCGAELDCFTRCCRDVAIVLTPYDLLRLKRALRMDSSELLEKHTLRMEGPEQKFPIVLLRMRDDDSRQCPFLCKEGCEVYPDRPWACRMYPLGAAEPKAPAGSDQPFHFVVREELCHGHGMGAPVSVRDWMAGQQIEEFEMMSAGFKELTLHEFWDGKTSLTPQQSDMFYMACYDVDRFRRFVFETRFLQLFDVDEARVEALRTDDEELVDFGMQWLRFAIFGERSMKIRRDTVAREGGQ
jgi:uncharacterized protein